MNHLFTKIMAVVGAYLILPTVVFAQGGLEATGEASGLSTYGSDVIDVAGNILAAALSLAGVIFFIMMVYGGFKWMLARGNDDEVQKAIKTIWAAVTGILVIFASYAITTFVFNAPQSPTNTNPDLGNEEDNDNDNGDTGGNSPQAGVCSVKLSIIIQCEEGPKEHDLCPTAFCKITGAFPNEKCIPKDQATCPQLSKDLCDAVDACEWLQ